MVKLPLDIPAFDLVVISPAFYAKVKCLAATTKVEGPWQLFGATPMVKGEHLPEETAVFFNGKKPVAILQNGMLHYNPDKEQEKMVREIMASMRAMAARN